MFDQHDVDNNEHLLNIRCNSGDICSIKHILVGGDNLIDVTSLLFLGRYRGEW